jgi:hypothetical protein
MYILSDGKSLTPEIKNRIKQELPGTMISNAPSAVCLANGNTFLLKLFLAYQQMFGLKPGFPDAQNRRMLENQNTVR